MPGADPFVILLPVIGFVLAFLCLLAALRNGKRRRLMDNLPTSKTTGVFIGLVELKGTAESEGPLTSYLASASCVHYSWNVDEHWSRTVTETHTDSDGKTHTSTRHESGWTNVANGGETIAFYLKDDCGVVLVRPEGAKIEPVTIFEETCGRMDPLYYSKGPPGAVANTDHRRRFVETAIPLHQQLYVMGQAREREDIVAPQIIQDEQVPMFLISARTEEQVSSKFGRGFWGWLIFGFVLCIVGVVARDARLQQYPARGWLPYVVAVFGFLAVFAIGWVWMVYNSMVELRQRVRQAWSQVDVQLRRRHDLIPNLLTTVQGYRDYEQSLQTEIAALRSQLTATPPGVAGADYRAVNRTLIAIVERYPDLKANTSFATLQQNLVDTEQRIALARGYFNDIATFYNTRLQIVPDKFVASLASMKLEPLMEANEFERAPVAVKLAPA